MSCFIFRGEGERTKPPPLTDEQARAFLSTFPDLKAAFKDDLANAKGLGGGGLGKCHPKESTNFVMKDEQDL